MPGVAIFADITKIITRFIKKIFKDSKKVKKKWKLCTKTQSITVFLEKLLMSAELRGCVT